MEGRANAFHTLSYRELTDKCLIEGEDNMPVSYDGFQLTGYRLFYSWDRSLRVAEPDSALGIKKPVDLSERVLNDSIHVYTESASFADNLANLATNFPRDETNLNVTIDGLHNQGCVEWVDEVSTFAHLVFVLWRTVHGKEQGLTVIDWRALNRMIVPDNYPRLPQAAVGLRTVPGVSGSLHTLLPYYA
ncbi:uncharacterized protein B0I36DRAFT_356362 [Microdochium trichocladiopsis]|uniref:Uncharacterized protein n=1 Tax=Microdochium trichocladiopsis TaxID=1682393 RepID=A0A9P8XSE1_9PEZI|nr:uncharacterized protein B0I36DRAFT_356362 [Microdochium trichocladiopsis]KAH7012292.1 hypothetical protein B0I36DRAFT_356362 [Microdochium trichocladiopsis]